MKIRWKEIENKKASNRKRMRKSKDRELRKKKKEMRKSKDRE